MLQRNPDHLPTEALAAEGKPALLVAAGILAIAILLIDVLTPLEGAVAVLYVIVILLLANFGRRIDLISGVVLCTVFTLASYFWSHHSDGFSGATVRAFVSVAAIAIAADFAFRNRKASEALTSQARLIDLSHDGIFVRDARGIITFWSSGAAALYGWTAEEAKGQVADDLLRTAYPQERGAIWDELTGTGRWEGELTQYPRGGSPLTVHSRWALQRDRRGNPVSVMQSETDVTERRRALLAITESERRYRAIFETSRIGIVEEDWTAAREAFDALIAAGVEDLAAYVAANPAFVDDLLRRIVIVDANSFMRRLSGASNREDLPKTLDGLIGTGETSFPRALAALARGERYFEGETMIGDPVTGVPTMFGITFPQERSDWKRVFVFVVDITERNEAQQALMQAQADLAHVARVSTLGELTASIAHEVNQPLAAIVTNGEAALRWLGRAEPDLGEVDAALRRVIQNGKRASEVVSRIRGYLRKTAAEPVAIDIGELAEEAQLLLERELMRHAVSLRMEIPTDLPAPRGDRVQVQQVFINLLVNAIQAMAAHGGDRNIEVSASTQEGLVLVEVSDTGPGLGEEDVERLFKPFFTTKDNGMGMGLAICRSIVEAHGGKLSARNGSAGAIFWFTLSTQGSSS